MSCNTPIGDKWDAFMAQRDALRAQQSHYLQVGQTMSPVGKLLDSLGITRLCCRKHFIVAS